MSETAVVLKRKEAKPPLSFALNRVLASFSGAGASSDTSTPNLAANFRRSSPSIRHLAA